MNNTFRCFARARPQTTTAYLFPKSATTSTTATTSRRAAYYSTRPKMASAAAASATDVLQSHGATIAKGIAVAGVSGVLISKFMMASADADAPASNGSDAALKQQQHEGTSVSGKKVFGRAGPVFQSLALESSEDVNHNTKRLRFKLPGDADITGLPLTSALLTVSFPNGSWTPCPRPYTPISPSDTPGVVDFLIKKYPTGRQSPHLHSLSPGDKVMFAVVIPGYKWVPNQYDAVTLVAGGAGITPCYQLIQGVLNNPADKTKIRLVFGVNSEEDVLLRKELEGLENRFGKDRFSAVYAVSSGMSSADSRFRKGYVTEELLKEVAVPASSNTKIMVCGPPPMEEALLGKKGFGRGARSEGILTKLGYRRDQIHQF